MHRLEGRGWLAWQCVSRQMPEQSSVPPGMSGAAGCRSGRGLWGHSMHGFQTDSCMALRWVMSSQWAETEGMRGSGDQDPSPLVSGGDGPEGTRYRK